MKKSILRSLTMFTLLAVTGSAAAQDHSHLEIGAIGTNQNDQLIFDNAAIFETAGDYVKSLTYTTSGTYAGYFVGNITFTVLAATPAHLGPKPNAPALGAWISAQLESVDGPPGGVFSFWESGATAPTISLVSGTTGTNTWRVSETDGSPETDPFGHIHGRRFTATRSGIYTVGFRAFDFSTNGVSSGPIHTPSSVLKVHFQAGDNIRSIESDADQTRVSFGARAGYSWQLQATKMMNPPDWQAIGAPINGDDYFHEVTDDTPVETNRVYRVKGTPTEP